MTQQLKLARRVNNLVNNKNFPEIWKQRRITASVCPRLFGFIKTHKDPISVRPIIEKRKAPTYALEKALAKWCLNKLKVMQFTSNTAYKVLESIKQL